MQIRLGRVSTVFDVASAITEEVGADQPPRAWGFGLLSSEWGVEQSVYCRLRNATSYNVALSSESALQIGERACHRMAALQVLVGDMEIDRSGGEICMPHQRL